MVVAVGASESLVLLALIGIPSIFTLIVLVLKRWCCLWKVALVWSIGLALLVWSLDPALAALDEPWTILSDPYLWILVLFVVSMANIGAFRGKMSVYLFGIGSLIAGALLFWVVFPASVGWVERIPIADQWRPLVELIGWTWIAASTSAILSAAYLSRGGLAIGALLAMYAIALTYLGWLTYQQVTTWTIVPHSIAVLLVIQAMFGAAALLVIPAFWPNRFAVIFGAGMATALLYVVFAVLIPWQLVTATGYPIILSGWWPF